MSNATNKIEPRESAQTQSVPKGILTMQPATYAAANNDPIKKGLIWSIIAITWESEEITREAYFYVTEPHTVQELRAYYWDMIYRLGLHSSQREQAVSSTSKQAA